ncbi:hypothetical protein [Haloarcula salinisoli]|uniref:DUF7847 domain-containing protein n=1 Tax=Haloarcula salinisoli TaxID=2487746 RepID=A0A8J8C9Y9_9EURY|nr:hypothetical protein [Halomicroarcula salinisoli]MBX0286054.1 hypothetical protein [Halomicroarcula salinisoli]MBX0302458.1 hypothetical protein [Halomicroarcula salinisoli]
MNERVHRQNAIETLTTAAGWLPKAPALAGLFLIVALVSAAGQLNALVSLLGSLLSLIASGVAFRTADDLAAGRSPAVADHIGTVVRRTPTLVGIGIVAAIATVVGLVFFVIPGIYIALRLGLSGAACVVDDLGVSDSLSTSWEVAEGNLLKLFGIHLVTGIVGGTVLGVLLFTLASPVALLVNDREALFTVFLGLAPFSAVLRPITSLAVSRVYLENRGEDDEENLTTQPGDDDWREDDPWQGDDAALDGPSTADTSDVSTESDDQTDADGSDDDPAGSWPDENR